MGTLSENDGEMAHGLEQRCHFSEMGALVKMKWMWGMSGSGAPSVRKGTIAEAKALDKEHENISSLINPISPNLDNGSTRM